jgi:two-component system, sensor histidine kinase and response regulator
MEATRGRVLVVDDNETNRIFVEETLAPEGYEVVTAASGAEALERFLEARPDCVLLDVRMPGMDGFQTIERLRQLPEGRETPVLFLTALRDLDTFDRALRQGGDDFLTKPIHPATLLARVGTLVRMRHLDSKLLELYGELRAQRDALTRSQLSKERLTAFLVHDLKSPISAMNLEAELISRDPSVSEETRVAATGIRREARRMHQMVLNLLDISKAEEGRLEPKRGPAELEALTADVALALDATAKSYGVSIERVVDPALGTVELDADLFRRVIENLVENGIRHARRKGTVKIVALRADGGIELRVIDSGPGVPAELREAIFDKYVQVESTGASVSRGGRGLGLAFCRLAIEAHGGTISVDPTATEGTFVVRVPR